MKKFLLLVFAAALGFAAVSCRDGKDSKTKEGGEFSFRKTTWGMSREQVKASEDTTPTGDNPEVITYRGEVEGIPAIVGYLFDGDKLTRAGYLMQGSYEDPNSYISDYNKVKDFLINEHGTPAQDEVVWAEGEEEVAGPGEIRRVRLRRQAQVFDYLGGRSDRDKGEPRRQERELQSRRHVRERGAFD